jgi:hypothetical protein
MEFSRVDWHKLDQRRAERQNPLVVPFEVSAFMHDVLLNVRVFRMIRFAVVFYLQTEPLPKVPTRERASKLRL